MTESILRDRKLMAVAIVVIVGAVMSILDTTIINVALQDLSKDLDAPLSTVQWVATGYMLALAAVIPLTGWASEQFGGKRVWIVAVALFTTTSALCGLAQNVDQLIALRILQGIGGGMIMPVGQIMLTQQAGPQRVGRVMSVIAVPMLLAPIFGPTIGGLIVDHLSWRWIFLVNVPVGLIGLLLARRVLPKAAGHGGVRLDWLGAILASGGAAAFVFGLSETGEKGGFDGAITWGPIAGGLLLIVLYVLHALRTPHAVINVRLFRKIGFSSASATTFVLGGTMFGAMILLPLYFQIARGEDATHAGLLLIPQGVGMAIAMPLSGVITDRIGGGLPTIVGVAVVTVTTFMFAAVGGDTSYVLISAILLVRGFGIGMSMMPSMAAAYATLSHADIPRATTGLNVLQRVGGAIGTALFTVILTRGMADRGFSGSLGEGTGSAQGPLPLEVRDRIADAFGHTFTWAAVITIVALAPAILLAIVEMRARRAAASGGADGGSGPGGGGGADLGPAGDGVAPVERAAVAAGGAGPAA